MTKYPTVDPEMLQAFLGGYMLGMRRSLEGAPDDYWQGYLSGLEAMNKSVLGWLERNAK